MNNYYFMNKIIHLQAFISSGVTLQEISNYVDYKNRYLGGFFI
jgi:hypothetical protein